MRFTTFVFIPVWLLITALCGCSHRDRPLPPNTTNLLAARAGFVTKPLPNSYTTDGTAPIPPSEFFRAVRYPSPAGQMFAYLSPDPGDSRKHPAVLWAHGGFGGIDKWLWEKTDQQDPGKFREAGIVVLCPSWRAENDNPGRFELFYGEVEDAAAAVKYLSQVPYVDPKRIYIAGHSTGGTITLLTAESVPTLRAAFSFGGCPDIQHLMESSRGKGYNNTPYDWHDDLENYWRSPINFVAYLHAPTFYFEGASSFYPADARRMEQRAAEVKKPFSAFIVAGGTHFSILQPVSALVAKKILADTGPTCNIAFTQEEVQSAFSQGQ
jgi:acetyl esterase/lipase